MLIQFLYIHVLGPPVVCMNPGVIIKSPPSSMITVKGENLKLNCSVNGTVLCNFNLYSTWNISSCHINRSINIHDNSTNPNYHLAVYQTKDCEFINQLTIHNISLDVNEAILTCIESADENGKQLLSSSNVKMSE